MKKEVNFTDAKFSEFYGFPPENTDDIFQEFYNRVYLRNSDDGYLVNISKSIRKLKKAIALIEICWLPINQDSILKSLRMALKVMENDKQRRSKGINPKGGKREDEELNNLLDRLAKRLIRNGRVQWKHIKWLIDWHREKHIFSPNIPENLTPWYSLLPSTTPENLRGRYNSWKKIKRTNLKRN